MKIINNTEETGYYLKEFLDNPPQDELELFHIIKFLSSYYDFIITDGDLVVCDRN